MAKIERVPKAAQYVLSHRCLCWLVSALSNRSTSFQKKNEKQSALSLPLRKSEGLCCSCPRYLVPLFDSHARSRLILKMGIRHHHGQDPKRPSFAGATSNFSPRKDPRHFGSTSFSVIRYSKSFMYVPSACRKIIPIAKSPPVPRTIAISRLSPPARVISRSGFGTRSPFK